MMKPISGKKWIYSTLIFALVACNSSKTKTRFELSGKIVNGTAKTIYLEELKAGSNESVAVDSFTLAKDGTYKLAAAGKESMIYNLRLDKGRFPVASVINDAPKMTLNITLQPGSNEFSEKYEVTGSPASQQMKDFIYQFNDRIQQIYPLAVRADSLRKLGVADSAFDPIREEWTVLAKNIKEYALTTIRKTDNPALYIFKLGYYQASTQQQNFGLEPISHQEEIDLLNEAITRFPDHSGLKVVRTMREEEWTQMNERMEEMNRPKWVGKPAPDFSLPDPNGSLIKLSSFKGKYVLVDFWASWCAPCRAENPNVVKVFNQFKDKNFTILGVSLDNPGEKNQWLDAIKKDKLAWTHVSDLKGWESIVVPMYDFGQVGIPYNLLLDPQGLVIAERLKGPELEKKLAEVLQ